MLFPFPISIFTGNCAARRTDSPKKIGFKVLEIKWLQNFAFLQSPAVFKRRRILGIPLMDERNRKENRPSYRKNPFQEYSRRQELEEKYYDNADMIRLFKVTSRTLQRWRDEKRVPFTKLGGKIYYLAHKVDALMEGGETGER